jgi:hypothetical protein
MASNLSQKDTAMIQVRLYYFLMVLEAFVVLAAFSGYLLLRLRRVAARTKPVPFKSRPQVPFEPTVARLDIVQYLARELERTSARVRHAQPGSDIALWLDLRAAVLQLEKEWSQQDDRSEIFWSALAGRLKRLVRDHNLIPLAKALKDRQDDEPGLADVVERQQHTIAFLKKYIHDVLTEVGRRSELGPVVDNEFARLEHTNHELQQCVAVLEDENQFLREQIASFLALEGGDQNASA